MCGQIFVLFYVQILTQHIISFHIRHFTLKKHYFLSHNTEIFPLISHKSMGSVQYKPEQKLMNIFRTHYFIIKKPLVKHSHAAVTEKYLCQLHIIMIILYFIRTKKSIQLYKQCVKKAVHYIYLAVILPDNAEKNKALTRRYQSLKDIIPFFFLLQSLLEIPHCRETLFSS